MSIYVGNIPYHITDQQLRELFEPVTQIQHVKIVRDIPSGRSKGFAFINLEDSEQEEAVIEQMEGFEIEDRKLRVIRAHNRTINMG